MIRTVTIEEFFGMEHTPALIDVRTPAEFAHGHIPCAVNLPLFSDEERVVVGTTYKQTGREAAILLGFDFTGPKWSQFIRDSLLIAPDKTIAVHCWRGGMRSGAMAWALDLYGFKVYLVRGGYKAYRQWARERAAICYHLYIVGGMTGSGKTILLHQLRDAGEQVIDLEALAHHQGSAFGSLNRMVQPTQEQFENNLAQELAAIDPQQPLFVEDESLKIGLRAIPMEFWNQMRAAPVVELQLPLEQRLTLLLREYGTLDKTFLAECTLRIQKRLGPEQTKHALTALMDDRMEEFIRLILVYYDKAYKKGLETRDGERIFPMPVERVAGKAAAEQLLNFIASLPEINS